MAEDSMPSRDLWDLVIISARFCLKFDCGDAGSPGWRSGRAPGFSNPFTGFVKMDRMAKIPLEIEFPATSFLYRSREFFAAAEQVLDEHNLLNMPLYFLVAPV